MPLFQYKYQICIDGTVAAYRFPYLLAGDSVVFKQESPYYEHFYKKLIPNEHYIPIKRDLSDLVEKLEWAKSNDERAKEIMLSGRQFAQENLLPIHILCYHARLYKEFSTRIVNTVQILPGMEKLNPPHTDCVCPPISTFIKDEL